MAIRVDPGRIEKKLDISGHNSKAEIRMALLLLWGQERPQTKYRYFVHTFADKTRLYLDRPARLNKGCDFIIYLEDQFLHQNGNDGPPKLSDLWNDLAAKQKQLTGADWKSLCRAIGDIHAVKPHQIPPSTQQSIDKLDGMNTDKSFHLCKWFFIEQDLTYWDGDGRNRFFDSLKTLPKFETNNG